MPYLTAQRKQELENPKRKLSTAGDLTYAMTMVVLFPKLSLKAELAGAIDRYLPKSPRYEDYAIVLGCIDSVKREYRRREGLVGVSAAVFDALESFADSFYADHVAPYEDTKIEQNGDVYGV